MDRAGEACAPLLTVEDLTVRYGGFVAVDKVCLTVGSRDVQAIIGPNGAGKTTLFHAISGLVKPAAGHVRFDGGDVTGMRIDRLSRLGVARSFQICAIFAGLSVEDNLRMALSRDCRGLGLLRRRHDNPDLDSPLDALLETAGLTADRHRPAGDLPYGRRRLLEIVTTLALRPRLLLLDEPTAGLAREDIPAVKALIADAAQSCGVLLIEHNLGVVEDLAAKVTVLVRGAVLCDGFYRDVARDPRVIEAYLGAPRDA